jgi:hypothetical protein
MPTNLQPDPTVIVPASVQAALTMTYSVLPESVIVPAWLNRYADRIPPVANVRLPYVFNCAYKAVCVAPLDWLAVRRYRLTIGAVMLAVIAAPPSSQYAWIALVRVASSTNPLLAVADDHTPILNAYDMVLLLYGTTLIPVFIVLTVLSIAMFIPP